MNSTLEKLDMRKTLSEQVNQSTRALEDADFDEALKRVWTGAASGDPYSQNLLGTIYEESKDFVAKQAFKWYDAAAQQGNALAQFNLGVMLCEDLTTHQNCEGAAGWFYKAAMQGHVEAQIWLGMLYVDGTGVSRNFKEAIRWFTLAARAGSAEGQFNLGKMYCNGMGCEINLREAAKWTRLAADQTHSGAQNSLGEMFYVGRGVSFNQKEAVKWWQLAAEQGNEAAIHHLKLLKDMGPESPMEDLCPHDINMCAGHLPMVL